MATENDKARERAQQGLPCDPNASGWAKQAYWGERAFRESLERNQASTKAWFDSSRSNDSVPQYPHYPRVSRSERSTQHVHSYAPTFVENVGAVITAPFRWFWALVTFVVRAVVWLLKVALVLVLVAILIVVGLALQSSSQNKTPAPLETSRETPGSLRSVEGSSVPEQPRAETVQRSAFGKWFPVGEDSIYVPDPPQVFACHQFISVWSYHSRYGWDYFPWSPTWPPAPVSRVERWQSAPLPDCQ